MSALPTPTAAARRPLSAVTGRPGLPARLLVQGCVAWNFPLAGMRPAIRGGDTGLVLMGEPLRCVIVDDNSDFLDAAARLLERQGICVVGVARSSSDGLQRVDALRPDVALVDIDLGGESGFELVEQLHRSTPGAGLPVILISTHAEQDFAELIATSPAVAFLPKSALSGPAIREALGLLG
jgi:CheY-like chemotaxis protein